MWRRSSLGVIALVIVLEAAGTRADPLRLTIDEAVARATATNLDLQASRKDIRVAEANFERSRMLLPSNPFFTAGAQHTGGFAANYSFSVSQEFEIAGQRRARIRVAEKEIEKVTWEVKTAEQALAATAKTAFVHALIGLDRVTVARQSVDVAAQLVADLQPQTAPSDRQRIDLNQARIQEARARREMASAEQTREVAFAALRRLLGLPFEQEMVLAGAPETEVHELPAAAELIARALERRPDLIGLRHAVEHADLHVALTRREGIPNVTLSGTVARFEGDTLAGGDVSVPIPVFQRKAPEIHEALAEYDRTTLQVQDLEREVAKQVREARLACTVSGADLEAQQKQIVPMSEENLAIERRLRKRGEVGTADVLGLQVDLLAARHDYLDALEAYNSALIELNRVSGGSLSDE